MNAAAICTICKLSVVSGPKILNDFVVRGGRTNVDAETQLLMTLWIMATPDIYRYLTVFCVWWIDL